MDREDEKLLEDAGWNLDCESPLEISKDDGSFARYFPAQLVIDFLREEAAYDEDEEEKKVSCCYNGGEKHNFEGRYSTENVDYKDCYKINKTNKTIYIGEACTWCGAFKEKDLE